MLTSRDRGLHRRRSHGEYPHRRVGAVIAILRNLANEEIAVLVAAHDQHLIDAAESRTQLA